MYESPWLFVYGANSVTTPFSAFFQANGIGYIDIGNTLYQRNNCHIAKSMLKY